MRTTILALILLLAGCSARPAVLYQNSTIDALLDGNYDGEVTFAELKRHGDFGLGTFDAVDGEMIVLDGKFYQMRADGSVSRVADDTKTPFSAVTFFDPIGYRPTPDVYSYKELQEKLDVVRSPKGLVYAIGINGRFKSIKIRSVGRQSPPYPPLADVVKSQSVWELKDIEGSLIGFWFPESLKHVNVPGYHFHFISKDRKQGGHVLDLTVQDPEILLQAIDAVHIAVPHRAPTVRSTSDREKEMRAVEK